VTLGKGGRSEGEYREALQMVDEQAKRLTRIVEDMFTLARADSSTRALRFQDLRLDELVRETSRAAEILADNKGIAVKVGRMTVAPYHGDGGLLRQLLMNLLDNAIKHTLPGGFITLDLEKLAESYVITVADTGAGIPEDAQARIFDRFYRVDKARSRSEASELGGGAGLGLSISKWIAEVHQGRLELQRSDKTGSSFVITLPLIAG
jgi:signal transduction histidine kinase